MSKITLYSLLVSPPCRAVLMVGEAIGIDFDVHEISLINNDHKKEDFLKVSFYYNIFLNGRILIHRNILFSFV